MLIAPSGITRFLECPEKFWLSLNHKPLPIKTELMEQGIAIHEVIAEYYRSLMSADGITPSEFESKLAVATKKCGMSDQMVKRFKWHLRNFLEFEYKRVSWSTSIKPIAVEKRFEKPPFKGIIDAMFKKGKDLIVVDWKSGKTYHSLPDWYKIQGCIYKYITGADEVVFYFLRSGSYVRLQHEDCREISPTISKVLTDIKNGVRYKREGKHCLTCEYAIACHYRSKLRWFDDAYWIAKAVERT